MTLGETREAALNELRIWYEWERLNLRRGANAFLVMNLRHHIRHADRAEAQRLLDELTYRNMQHTLSKMSS